MVLASWRLTGVVAYFLVWLILPMASSTPSAPGLDANTRAGMRTVDKAPARNAAAEWGQLIALAALGGGLTWLIQGSGVGLPSSWFAVGVLFFSGLAIVWWQADHAVVRGVKAPDGPLAFLAPLLAHWTTAVGLGIGVLAIAVSVVLATITLPLDDSAVAARTLSAAAIALGALAAIAAPWLLRARRALVAAREARLVADARADMAAHLHDSVLQTLALIQKQAQDPREVTRLARRQERELRSWLYGAEPEETTLKAALEQAAQDIEDQYPVNVELVTVGDTELTPRLAELVKAAREAILNAAKHSRVDVVDVYAEVDDARVEVFVRDRGIGFDPDAVPSGRLGVGRSIIDRMQRHGGAARLRSTPDNGTEVTLEMTS